MTANRSTTSAPDGGAVWTAQLLEAPHQTPDKADRVRRMFDGIAARYELVNSLFSLGQDARWRNAAVRLAGVSRDDEVMDVACGTGDFARAFAAAGPRLVVGCDFASQMLRLAVARGTDRQAWCQADALKLPFRSESFSIASCAFGVRNFADLSRGLREMHRVLRPGGRVVILEFTRPRHRLLRRLCEVYCDGFMPRAAAWISGDRVGAYRYLSRSVVSFLTAEQMCERLRTAGFREPQATPLTFGLVTVYLAKRA